MQAGDLESPEETVDRSNFILDAMDKAVDPLTRTIADVKIDTSQFALANNFYDFVANIVGAKVKMPFARQLWIGIHLFADYCSRCSPDDLCSDITAVPVDEDPHELAARFTLLKNGRCPKCHATKGELIESGELNDYTEFVGVLGQRSGKSTIVAIFCAYIIHRLLKVPRLSTICRGIQEFTPITGTFVALSFNRAIRLLWNPYTEIVKASQWFEDYHSHLIGVGKSLGKELFKDNNQFQRYFHRNIDLYPLGPLKRALRGDTRCMAATDELGWFPYEVVEEGDQPEEDDAREIANADEVHASLSNSLMTLRTEVATLYEKGIYHIPTGMNLNISSPASWRDKICRLLKDSEGSRYSLGVRLPTWEVNPSYSRSHPVIADAYRKNAIKADRDFGANPPSLTSSRYDKERVQSMFTGRNHHIAIPDTRADNTIAAKIHTVIDRHSWPPTALALDAGYTNNSFSFALGTLDQSQSTIFTVGEVMPQIGRKIHFGAMFKDVLLKLCQECNVKYVFADRWNSILLLQQLQDEVKGLQSMQYSLKRKDFDTFDTDYVESGMLVLPKLEIEPAKVEAVLNYRKELAGRPASHLYLQFLTVAERQGQITKGDGYTDDIYRALVLLCTMLKNPKVKEEMDKQHAKVRTTASAKSQVLVAGRSGQRIR